MSREIPLTQGQVAIVDDEDFEWLNQWKWCALKQGKRVIKYRAVRGVQQDGRTKIVLMHRVIMDAPDGIPVDHRDGNPLNNQRSNLRLCTQQQNMMNGSAHVDSVSKFKGVCWDSDRRKWRVGFLGNYVGLFGTEIEAAIAYDEVAREHAGPFAKLNFPEGARP